MRILHHLAKTYGRLPSEFLKLEWAEYQFCVAVLLASGEDDAIDERPMSSDWSRLI